jgi:hypothetical protein
MTMTNTIEPTDGMKPNNNLNVEQNPNETGAQAVARKLLEPQLRHALISSAYADKMLGSQIEAPGIMDYVNHMQEVTGMAETGDLSIASRLLASQAITLDAMFTELARRAAINMSEHLEASERYGRLALKAQSNSRATLEALTKLHQPREQTVRHVYVNAGGQAVIADEFHHHSEGAGNGKNGKQSHATGKTGGCAALSSSNAQGNGVRIPSGERAQALQNARGDESRSA